MDQRKTWTRRHGWWMTDDWGIHLKFTEKAEKNLKEWHPFQLRDVVQYVTHVQRFHNSGPGLRRLFNAMNSREPSLVQHISLQNDDTCVVEGSFASDVSLETNEFDCYHPIALSESATDDLRWLAAAIRRGCLRTLKCLEVKGGNGHSALATAIASGGLPSLKTLTLRHAQLIDNQFKEYWSAMALGKLPNLCCLDVSSSLICNAGAQSLALGIRSGNLNNLAELRLNKTGLTDEGLVALTDFFRKGVASLLPNLSYLDLSFNTFTDVGLLSLGEALKSGHLNSLEVLDVRDSTDASKHGASAFVSALTNNSLIVDVKFEWYKFQELGRRRVQLLERNHRHKNFLAGLVTVLKVQATFGKVHLCGSQEVGKTTLARTLQRSYWESVFTWETRPHVEERTRGVEISQLLSMDKKPDEPPITLLVWDMAGQEDFHLVHNAFFRDLGFAESKATTFIVVCSSRNTRECSLKQLQYWLRYIASSCDKTVQNPREVFVVMNNFESGQNVDQDAERYWKVVLEGQRDRFKHHLNIRTDFFLVDVRKFQQVTCLKRCLLEHSRSLLINQKVPSICQAIEKNLRAMSEEMKKFPVLHWTEFYEQVRDQLPEYWPEPIIEAACKYLNEVGVLIYMDTEVVKLVVMDPNWLCKEIIGHVLLP